MKYHALFDIFEKAAKFDMSSAIIGGTLWVHTEVSEMQLATVLNNTS